MCEKVIELRPTVIHENCGDDIAEYADVMDLIMEDIKDINKGMKALYENEV